MTADWLSYIQSNRDGTYHIAFRRLSFPRMMEMLHLYVENERERMDIDEWPAMPDEGV